MVKQIFGGTIKHSLTLAVAMGTAACAPSEKTDQTPVTYAPPASAERPNILVIVTDDMGMADLGSFGSEIETPHLDKLSYDGIRLTNFYASPVCSVTRAKLLTGVDSHKAGLGNMAEDMADNQSGQPGYEGYLNTDVVTIASLLKDSGYNTYLSGKWHLGMTAETAPSQRGFERSFTLLSGGASHFSDMLPAYHPDPKAVAPYRRNGEKLEKLPEGFEYSTQFYVDELIDHIEADEDEDKPFFAVLGYTAPHWPLQAPDATIAKYKGRYDKGADHLRKARLKRQKQLGIMPLDAEENTAPPKGKDWTTLSASEKATEIRAMEIYAAMIDEIDQHTGRLIQTLKSKGEFDNTMIIFLSDNGAEGHDMEETWPADKYPKIRANIDSKHDFSFENMGRPNSYVFYGPNWARAGAPSFRMHKGFPTEGGIRVPAFVHYKGFEQEVVSNRFFNLQDIAPTILDVANVDHPAPMYKGRTVHAMTGQSLVPIFTDAEALVKNGHRLYAGEVLGKYFIRKGPWKMVNMPPPAGTGEWQLYNIETDISEKNDLSAQSPEIKSDLITEWDNYVKANGVILPDWVSGY